MPSSLRWKLLAWHALWVAVITSVFVAIAWVGVSRSINERVDQQLGDLAKGLVSRMTVQFDGKFVLELLPEQIERFRQTGDQYFYYRIWNVDEIEVDSSNPELEIPYPKKTVPRDRNGGREVIEPGPGGSIVLVGRSMKPERGQLVQLAYRGVLIGSILLLVMLAGGWFLINKALSPINRINDSAMAISESNLSERIDASQMETELAQLSETINGAFDRLEGAVDRQTKFTADASHELRTPLSIMLAHAEYSLREPRSKEGYAESIRSIHGAATRMKAVVEGLLTLARADSDQAMLRTETFDLKELVQGTCSLLLPLAVRRNIELSTNLADVEVNADRDRIGEAVSNLVSNAIQYNNNGGKVDVRLDAKDGVAKLTVSDTGQGIAPADLPFVFERFFQVDRARHRIGPNRGSGLGLSITKWIAEAHGGSVSVSSEAGVGSQFVLKINVA